jgi:hypothetical protein
MTLQETRIQQALRAMPSAGWLGRRDRALLVLSQMAGLAPEEIAKLTAADVVIADGVATITTSSGVIRLAASGDALICGPCALARWLHVLNLTAVYSDRCVIDSVIARGAPLSTHSPHRCDGTAAASDSTAQLLLLPPIDRWGLIAAVSAPRPPRDARPSGAAGHTKARPHRSSGTRNGLGH